MNAGRQHRGVRLSLDNPPRAGRPPRVGRRLCEAWPQGQADPQGPRECAPGVAQSAPSRSSNLQIGVMFCERSLNFSCMPSGRREDGFRYYSLWNPSAPGSSSQGDYPLDPRLCAMSIAHNPEQEPQPAAHPRDGETGGAR